MADIKIKQNQVLCTITENIDRDHKPFTDKRGILSINTRYIAPISRDRADLAG
ncbi:hypothetical protein [Phormidium nigroviride]